MDGYELIQSIIYELDSINVPVCLMQQVGVPLFNANGKLKSFLKSITEANQKNPKEAENKE